MLKRRIFAIACMTAVSDANQTWEKWRGVTSSTIDGVTDNHYCDFTITSSQTGKKNILDVHVKFVENDGAATPVKPLRMECAICFSSDYTAPG